MDPDTDSQEEEEELLGQDQNGKFSFYHVEPHTHKDVGIGSLGFFMSKFWTFKMSFLKSLLDCRMKADIHSHILRKNCLFLNVIQKKTHI